MLICPSGCRKNTLLRLLAGIDVFNSGEILIGDKFINHILHAKRDVAMAFRNYALYPPLNVQNNLSFSLRRIFKRSLFKQIDDQMHRITSKLLDSLKLISQREKLGEERVRFISYTLENEQLLKNFQRNFWAARNRELH